VNFYPINTLKSEADLAVRIGLDVFILGYPFGNSPPGFPVWKTIGRLSTAGTASDSISRSRTFAANQPIQAELGYMQTDFALGSPRASIRAARRERACSRPLGLQQHLRFKPGQAVNGQQVHPAPGLSRADSTAGCRATVRLRSH
jgi:hypothetical protein